MAPMPPTTAARWITISGRAWAYIRATESARRRSQSREQGPNTSAHSEPQAVDNLSRAVLFSYDAPRNTGMTRGATRLR